MEKELIQKAKTAQSPEELVKLARENGVYIPEAHAQEVFDGIQKYGELSDDELNSASGGGCFGGGNNLKDFAGISLSCPKGEFVPDGNETFWRCGNCGAPMVFLPHGVLRYCSCIERLFGKCIGCDNCSFHHLGYCNRDERVREGSI